MEASTILTLISVVGIVWGGLLFFIFKAVKYENLKHKNGQE